MPADSSFDDLLARLRAGDDSAASRIYKQFARRLIGQARKSLPHGLRPKEDPEDAVQSALGTFFKHVNQGEFELDGWDSLEALLVRITVRKCARRVERYTAGRRDARRELRRGGDVDDSLSHCQAMAHDPTPDEAAQLVETLERLYAGLTNEKHREILQLRLEGHTVPEIAGRVGRSERLVHRVLDEVKKGLRHWLEEGA
ncbi:MAG TPA: sigma-70 family RNA polymerase sigma factor [Pirellulales bacterium]|nr:sigma-70 family RNA polymerase sigma factor [Pirellulales bacterium]